MVVYANLPRIPYLYSLVSKPAIVLPNHRDPTYGKWTPSPQGVAETPLALPHYDTRDASVIADLPYMVVSHDSGQWHIALSQLENALPCVLEPLTS